MSGNWVVLRDYTDDGVMGLNGNQYLLDDDGNVMEFTEKQKAIDFLMEHGVDIEDDEGISLQHNCEAFFSACCGAEEVGESGFCPACKDHTGFECPECDVVHV